MTENSTLATTDLLGKRVVSPREKKDTDRRIGKVRRFVFHPQEKRCIGFIVKRPDVALMFHRKDLFVAIDGFDLQEGVVHLRTDLEATGSKAIKRLGVDWDACVMWMGMQVVTESGEEAGRVGGATFDAGTGKVESIEVDNGATAKALLGAESIPASMIKGFRFGIGSRLSGYEEEDLEDDDGDDIDEESADPGTAIEKAEDVTEDCGAILVSDEVLDLSPEGGFAEKAGKATVVAADKSKKAVEKAKADAREAHEKAKPGMEKAAKKTEEALNKGAYLTGKQIGKSKGMFANFMGEYHKALEDDDTDKDK